MVDMAIDKMRALLAAVFSGGLVAAVYLLFTTTVDNAQEFVWFELGGVDENKIMAIPLALIGGLVMAGTLRFAKMRGHQEIGHTIPAMMGVSSVTATWLVRTLLIGFISLVAGASLGPEAVLIPVAYGIGFLIGKATKCDPSAIGLMGIIALLAAFFNSYAAALVPLGFALASKNKDVKTMIAVILTGVLATAASITVLRILREQLGYVSLPSIGSVNFSATMLGAAILIAAITTLLPFLLEVIVKRLKTVFSHVSPSWYWQGLVAGLGVGILYFLLGPVGFFSGSSELPQLLTHNSEYTSLQLGGLAIGKLLVTAWCIATIYRGGLVFPQLVIAMSLALLFSGGIPDNSWLMTLLAASFFGVFTGSLGSLFIAAAFVLPLFGFVVWPVVLAAAVGSFMIKYGMRKRFASSNAV